MIKKEQYTIIKNKKDLINFIYKYKKEKNYHSKDLKYCIFQKNISFKKGNN